MKKCIVISDSFKGSLSSGEICEIARESFQNVFPACKLVCIPVADGGEGTVACFQEVCGGELEAGHGAYATVRHKIGRAHV